MTANAATSPMDADAFLAWGEGRDGRWELRDGAAVAMSPESLGHVRTKTRARNALAAAIAQAGKPCEAIGDGVTDGVTVRINARNAYQPDAVVVCGRRLDPEALEASDPVIILEVLSPSTASIDHGRKFTDYFSLPSVAHYLILDADRRVLIHHARGEGDVVVTRVLANGVLRLDPPGIMVDCGAMFAEA